MDLEVVEAIESLRDDIGRVESSLRAEFWNGFTQLRAEMVTKGGLKSELDQIRAEMVTKGGLRSELEKVRAEMASMREQLIRHTDIRYESLHGDIRILAKGFAVLSAKLDTFRPPAA